MNAVRKTYDDLPINVEMPLEMRHKKAELIIIPLEESSVDQNIDVKRFFGSIPDFPERSAQGVPDQRDIL